MLLERRRKIKKMQTLSRRKEEEKESELLSTILAVQTQEHENKEQHCRKGTNKNKSDR